MFLKCPECATKFVVQASQIGKGRSVRCGLCKHEWFQTMEALSANGVPLITSYEQEPEPLIKGSNVPAVISKSNKLIWFCKAGSLVLGTAMVLFTLFATRESMMQYFPQTTPIYEKLGVYSFRDVQLEDVLIEKKEQEGNLQIHIYGKIINQSGEVRHVPARHFNVYTHDGRFVTYAHSKPDQLILKPGESINFHDIISQIPDSPLRVTLDIGNLPEIALR